jgi:Mycothiol maleylpyruvate isomerase N-terminal domain
MAVVTTAEHDALLATLQESYGNLTEVTAGLTDDELMRPTRCAGWVIADVLFHQLLDARRALITFASPAPTRQPPDVDEVTYWQAYSPRSAEPSALGSPGAARHAQYVRIAASAYPPGTLVGEWRETSLAACRAAQACPYATVATQGHVLTTTDFISTLVVESAIHFLDLTSELVPPPAPEPDALAVVRRVLDGLLGTPMPGDWDDVSYALKGTGRVPVSPDDRIKLGPLADLLPLFG